MSLAILLPVLVVGCLQDISVKAHRSETRMLSDALKGLGNFLLVFLHLQNHTSSFSAALAFTRRSHLLTITTCAPRRVKKEFTIPAFTFEKRLYINFVPKSVVCLSVMFLCFCIGHMMQRLLGNIFVALDPRSNVFSC